MYYGGFIRAMMENPVPKLREILEVLQDILIELRKANK